MGVPMTLFWLVPQIPLWHGMQPSSYLNDQAVGKVAKLLGLSAYDLRQAVEQEARTQVTDSAILRLMHSSL